MTDARSEEKTDTSGTRMCPDLSRVHMVGIGGAGMSGIARILLSMGKTVTGSDVKDSRIVLALVAMGAKIAIGHDEKNLELNGADPTVVVTSFAAIPKNNPELLGARARGIPVITRSDLLAVLMHGYRQLLIAGTHGKTSTTSMAVVALQAAGLDPSFSIGGQLNKAGTNAHHGTGECFVAEADESDASLLSYEPTVAVVTNVEPDHLDFFGTEEAYYQVFDDFARRIRPGGVLVVCLDDPHAAALGERCQARLLEKQERQEHETSAIRVVGYGTAAAVAAHPSVPAALTVTDVVHTSHDGSHATFTLAAGAGSKAAKKQSFPVRVHIPGTHMVLNAAGAVLGAVLISALHNPDPAQLAAGISGFTGVRRRFEVKGTIGEDEKQYAGCRIVDDYAHHPTEVAAVVAACRDTLAEQSRGKLIVCFQPHLYSRSMRFKKEFAAALSGADAVIVLDIYPAREKPVEGVDGRIISDLVTCPCTYVPSFTDVPDVVAKIAGPGDMIVTMGAGSVTMLGEEILHTLSEKNRD